MPETWTRRFDISEHYGRTGWLVLALTALIASSLLTTAALVGDETVIAQLHDLQDHTSVDCKSSSHAMDESKVMAAPHEDLPMTTGACR